jgi:hypothetical protein
MRCWRFRVGHGMQDKRDGRCYWCFLWWVIRSGGLDFPNYLFSLETSLHEATPSQLGPYPPPYPMRQFPHPRTHVGEPDLSGNAHKRGYRALGTGGQNGYPRPCQATSPPPPALQYGAVPPPPDTSTDIPRTVALIEFASSSFPAKVHLKKNPEVEKVDGVE